MTTQETRTRLRRPCENCPWRVDAPRGYWDPQHFRDIWRNCQDDGLHIMLCHKANTLPEEERPKVPCQGWIRVMGVNAIGVRLLVLRQQVSLEEIEDRVGPRLFPTFTAMLRANRIPLPHRSRMRDTMPDKRFFELDEEGEVYYIVVATDLDHAKRILRGTGVTFGDPPLPLDEATGITWSEMTPNAVAKIHRCHTEDDRKVIQLADAEVGDYFCSEW